MKIKRATYLSALLLSCFLISTTLGIAFSYSIIPSSSNTFYKSQAVSSSDEGLNISNGFNLLQAENEDERDFDATFTLQEFIIPFIFSFSDIEASYPVVIHYTETSVKETNPIYIAIRNFRI